MSESNKASVCIAVARSKPDDFGKENFTLTEKAPPTLSIYTNKVLNKHLFPRAIENLPP